MPKTKFIVTHSPKLIDINVSVLDSKNGAINTFVYTPRKKVEFTETYIEEVIDISRFSQMITKMNLKQLEGYGRVFLQIADYIKKIDPQPKHAKENKKEAKAKKEKNN